MNSELVSHLRNLPIPPVLDWLGRWAHLPNARVGTTSMHEGPLHARCILRHRTVNIWEAVWKELVPKLDSVVLFTFVRNPWDRVCSAFFQCRDRAKSARNKIDSKWTFSDWVRDVLNEEGPAVNAHFAEQYGTAYFRGERIALVGRFESLDEDWVKISESIGIYEKLPHLNSAGLVLNSSGVCAYSEYYDDTSRRIVGNIYRREIEAFGYKFGQ